MDRTGYQRGNEPGKDEIEVEADTGQSQRQNDSRRASETTASEPASGESAGMPRFLGET